MAVSSPTVIRIALPAASSRSRPPARPRGRVRRSQNGFENLSVYPASPVIGVAGHPPRGVGAGLHPCRFVIASLPPPRKPEAPVGRRRCTLTRSKARSRPVARISRLSVDVVILRSDGTVCEPAVVPPLEDPLTDPLCVTAISRTQTPMLRQSLRDASWLPPSSAASQRSFIDRDIRCRAHPKHSNRPRQLLYERCATACTC